MITQKCPCCHINMKYIKEEKTEDLGIYSFKCTFCNKELMTPKDSPLIITIDERKALIERIESFRELKENWDGYGASPIPIEVIDKCIDLGEILYPIPEVFPTANDSIQFEWEKNELYLEMEVFRDKIEMFNCIEGKEDDGIGG